jgi:hypothetical protein
MAEYYVLSKSEGWMDGCQMNIRTAILALIPLTIQAAPVLMPDGVNLDLQRSRH